MKKLFLIFPIIIVFTCTDTKYSHVIEKDGANIRTDPSVKSEKIVVIPYKAKVEILGYSQHYDNIYNTKSRWVHVKYHGKEGWVFGSLIEDDVSSGSENFMLIVTIIIVILIILSALYLIYKFNLLKKFYDFIKSFQSAKKEVIPEKYKADISQQENEKKKSNIFTENFFSGNIILKLFIVIISFCVVFIFVKNIKSIILLTYNQNEKAYLRLLIFNENVNRIGLNYLTDNCSFFKTINNNIYDHEIVRYINIYEEICFSSKKLQIRRKEDPIKLILQYFVSPQNIINDVKEGDSLDYNIKEINSLNQSLCNSYNSVLNFYSKLNHEDKQYFLKNGSFKFLFIW